MTEKTIEKFRSKKNSVYLVEKQGQRLIKKVYDSAQSLEIERKELALLAGLRVPEIVRSERNTLYLSYIEGALLLDEFLNRSTNDLPQLAKSLADFLLAYYRRRGAGIADANFRNFIIKDGECYGIDFDEPPQGDLKECAARFAAFCFLYTVSFERKTAFCLSLLEFLAESAIGFETQSFVQLLCARRGVAFNKEDFEAFLCGIERR